ncbi:unnamed protein product [Symbiodinium sp. CCMP2456]|nr:unnamed protein product [Symbiodinium sp. CCMP2456]
MVVYRPIATATANRPAAFSRPVIVGKASQQRPAYTLPRSFAPILRKTSAPAKDSQVNVGAPEPQEGEDPVDEFQDAEDVEDPVLDDFENAEANVEDLDADALGEAAQEVSEDAEGDVTVEEETSPAREDDLDVEDVAEDMREAVQGSMQLRRMHLDMHAAFLRQVPACHGYSTRCNTLTEMQCSENPAPLFVLGLCCGM